LGKQSFETGVIGMTTSKEKRSAKAGSITERVLKSGRKSYVLRVRALDADGVWRRKERTFRTKRKAEAVRRVIGKAREMLLRSKELGDWNLSLL
jgi:hypothetical protein